jgi:isopenicillin N synthase-like dioxygenase
MIYIPSFIKIGSAIQKLIRGDIQTHRKHGDCISLLLLFQNKESGLKISAILVLY